MLLQSPLAVVTPTIDGDVLEALALADARFTTGQLARQIPHRSVQGLRLVLQRLVGQGIVDAEPAGRAVLYSLNRDHLAAPAILTLADQRAELLRRIGADFDHWSEPPVYAALFGSAVNGDMRAESDIDILLVPQVGSEVEPWDEHVLRLAHRISRWTGNDARPLVLSVDEVASDAGAERLLRDIAATGITVAGASSWLRRKLAGKAR